MGQWLNNVVNACWISSYKFDYSGNSNRIVMEAIDHAYTFEGYSENELNDEMIEQIE
jgi:hypothetical protein